MTILCAFLVAALGGCGIFRKRAPRSVPIHVVEAGETLSGIATAYGATLKDLVRLNRIGDPNKIAVGDRIELPRGSRKSANVRDVQKALVKGIDLAHAGKGKTNPRRGELIWPVEGKPAITSGFGPRWGKMHKGVDFAGPVGTTVRAPKSGKVVHVGKDGQGPGRTYGNYVVLHHGDGLYTLYAHLSELRVAKGDRIGKKKKIGEIGSTGRSTGPHLHFEVIEGVREVDPMSYLPDA